jgi:hypothetical protein
VEVNVTLLDLASNSTVAFLGNEPTVFVLKDASPSSISVMLSSVCCSSSCNNATELRIPQGQNSTVLWWQAEKSPYTVVALTKNRSCEQRHFLKVFPLSSSVEVGIENDFNFTGIIFICYGTDGGHNLQYQSLIQLISVHRASPSSISRVSSPQLGGGEMGEIQLIGAQQSCHTYVAFLDRDLFTQCVWNGSHISRAVVIIGLDQGRDMQADSFRVELAAGSYKLCYTTSASPQILVDPFNISSNVFTFNWVLQEVPDLEVGNASLVVTSIAPSRAASDVAFYLYLEGVLLSPFTAVAVAAPGQCMNVSQRSTASLQDSARALFTLSSGVFVVCHSSTGLGGHYVQQANAVLHVIPSSQATSITNVWPAKLVTGSTELVTFEGFHVSLWTYVALSSSVDCQAISFVWISSRAANVSIFHVRVDVPGQYTVCYTTWGSDGPFSVQLPTVKTISMASRSSIAHIFPTRVSPFVETVFTLYGPGELYSSSSFVAFSLPQMCAHVLLNATVVSLLTNRSDFTASIPGEGSWVLCYSTSGEKGPFVQQGWVETLGPRVFGIKPARNSQISHLVPNRITIGLATEVEFSGVMFSEIHSYVAFSLPGNCSNTAHIYQLHSSSTATVNVSSSLLTQVCYSTSGPEGTFVAQTSASVHFVKNPGLIVAVLPSRISAADPLPRTSTAISGEQSAPDWRSNQPSAVLNFVGADFSPLVYVAFTLTKSCSEREYTAALMSGVGSQASALSISIRYPGKYLLCYSVTGNAPSSEWIMQQVQLTAVPAAITGLVTAIRVCANDPDVSLCVDGQRVRIPAQITFSVQFLGLDYSDSTRASFSKGIHPFTGRPDCTGSDWRSPDVLVSSGAGTQSAPFFSTAPDVGLWHVCISSEAGADDSWWPQGELIPATMHYVYIDVFEEATDTYVTSLKPESFERGKDFEMTIEGLQVSAFTRIGFAKSGECNTNIHSERTVDSVGSVVMRAPFWNSTDSSKIQEIYYLCCKQIGQPNYHEQTTNGVSFISMIKASSRAIEHLSLQFANWDSREHNSSLTISAGYDFSFLVYGVAYSHFAAFGISNASEAACTNVQICPVVTRAGEQGRLVNVARSGTYAICFSTVLGAAPVWFEQEGLIVNVIPKAIPTSIHALECVGPADRCLPRCTVSVRAQAGVILKFLGAHFSPSTRVAFSAVGNCQNRLLEAPILPDLSVEFVLAQPGMLHVCYATNYYEPLSDVKWVLQSSNLVHVTVETYWADAALVPVDSLIRFQTSNGGQPITVVGSGFDASIHYRCHLSLRAHGASVESTAASVISVDKLKCMMPPWLEPATLVYFTLRLGDGSVIEKSSPYDQIFTVPAVTDVRPLCGDKLGGDLITVSGFGFGGPSNWSFDERNTAEISSTLDPPGLTSSCSITCNQNISQNCQYELAKCISLCTVNATISNGSAVSALSYECHFETAMVEGLEDALYDASRPKITSTTEGVRLSSTVIICPTPRWSEVLWEFYRQDIEGRASLQVKERNTKTSKTVALMSSSPAIFSFTPINKAPDFLGSSLGALSRASYDSPIVLFSNWTVKIWKGRLPNDEDSHDEADQLLTFVVRARVPSFFEVFPFCFAAPSPLPFRLPSFLHPATKTYQPITTEVDHFKSFVFRLDSTPQKPGKPN